MTPSTHKRRPPARRKRGQRIDVGAQNVHVGTWLGRPGESHTIRLQSRDTGLRVIVQVWHDDAPADAVPEQRCSARLISGDFWRDPANAHEHARVLLPDHPTDDDVRVAIVTACARLGHTRDGQPITVRERRDEFDVFVGGWRVTTCTTEAGAQTRAWREALR